MTASDSRRNGDNAHRERTLSCNLCVPMPMLAHAIVVFCVASTRVSRAIIVCARLATLRAYTSYPLAYALAHLPPPLPTLPRPCGAWLRHDERVEVRGRRTRPACVGLIPLLNRGDNSALSPPAPPPPWLNGTPPRTVIRPSGPCLPSGLSRGSCRPWASAREPVPRVAIGFPGSRRFAGANSGMTVPPPHRFAASAVAGAR